MESDNSIKRLSTILEPLVWDLDDLKKQLTTKKEDLENASRFLAYTKDNLEMVGIYADQDLITSKFNELDISLDEYKASCYLLKSDDEIVKNLPQYASARELISKIIDYFVLHKAKLQTEIQNLYEVCEKKDVEKKYYDILSSSNPYIENISEFKNIMDEYIDEDDEKIKILLFILKNNITNYESGNK